jgi:energy-converting hydrogenase Eha subunit F
VCNNPLPNICFKLADILIYIQQDATLHSLFYLETALHVLGNTITHHQERKQLYLQHLVFVTPLLLYTAIVEELELV